MTTDPRPPRKNLLVVRAGDQSLHPGWLADLPAAERNWDLHVSYFGDKDDPFPGQPADVTLTREKGPKFSGLDLCLTKLEDRLAGYEYVGLPDDDLSARGTTWNRYFEVLAHHRPSLAQPALAPRSFYTFPELIRDRRFLLRWTNFVEVMSPTFSRDALATARPLFTENKSGWGMDHYWPHLFGADALTLCVVDETPVLHTRAVGVGGLYKLLKADGRSPYDERQSFLDARGIERAPFRVLAAVDRAGKLDRMDGTAKVRPPLLPRIRQRVRRKLGILQVS